MNPPESIDMSRGIFHDLLVELYDRNPAYKVDVVLEKRKKFQDRLQEANEALRLMNYPQAIELYQPLVTLLMSDVYIDELKLDEDSIFYIKCCFAYCYVKTFCDFDPLLSAILRDLKGMDRKELLPWMIQMKFDLVEQRWYSATQQYLAMKMIKQTCSSDQEPSETKKMFKELLPSDDKIMKDAEAIFESFMNKLVQEKEDVPMKTQGTQTAKTKMNSKSIQTDKLKRKNAEVQVEIDHPQTILLQEIKNKLDKDQDKNSKSFSTLHSKVSDMNSKLVKEYGNITTTVIQDCDRRCERYEQEIERLKEALEESERIKESEMKKKLEAQKMLLDQINDKFNCQVYVCKYLIRKCDYMTSYLSNLIKHLTHTSIPTVNSVKQEIQFWQTQHSTADTYLTNLNMLFKDVMLEFSQVGESKKLKDWPEQIMLPKENNLVFISFIPAIQNILDLESKIAQSLDSWNNSSYPNPKNGMPLYKDAVMMNLVPQMPSMPQFLPCAMGPNVAMAPRWRPPVFPMTPSGPYMPGPTMPGHITSLNMPGLVTGTSMPTAGSGIPGSPSAPGIPRPVSVPSPNRPGMNRLTPPMTARFNSSSPSNSSSDDGGEASGYIPRLLHFLYKDPETKEIVTEETLLQFLSQNLPGVSEDDLLMSMLAVLEKHAGTFKNVHKRTVLEDVREILKSKKVTFEALNRQIESCCTICFEEMKQDQIYNLSCKHKYHKQCIKTWLKKNSNCPICRTAATVND